MDIKSVESRSQNMARIRNRDTKPEQFIRKLLFSLGFRYSVRNEHVLGKPDIFFPKKKKAIFINGCFWHRHTGCVYSYTPKTNVDFWKKKFLRNNDRDRFVYSNLASQQVAVMVIWECSIKRMKKDEQFKEQSIISLLNFLKQSTHSFTEI